MASVKIPDRQTDQLKTIRVTIKNQLRLILDCPFANLYD
jgi:hypothetical protein